MHCDVIHKKLELAAGLMQVRVHMALMQAIVNKGVCHVIAAILCAVANSQTHRQADKRQKRNAA